MKNKFIILILGSFLFNACVYNNTNASLNENQKTIDDAMYNLNSNELKQIKLIVPNNQLLIK